MKRLFFAVCVTGVLACRPSPSQAITIAISPAEQFVDIGDTVSASLTIGDVGNLTAPSVSTFDIRVDFNSSLLAFQTATLGDPVLGDQLDPLGLGAVSAISPGAGFVQLFALSLDAPSVLDAMQAGDFTLATLTFTAVAAGISPLTPAVNALGDSTGQPLVATVVPAKVTIVPEPGTLLLVGAALGALACWRRASKDVCTISGARRAAAPAAGRPHSREW